MATAAAHADAKLLAFRRELDALHERTRAKLGAEDLAYLESILTWSRRCEIAGRGLIHVSLDPLTWSAGVLALWVHKQLETTELAHMIWHGAYDQVRGAEQHVASYRSKVPVWVPGWKHVHNVLHHGFTNIVGKDPDARFGSTRLVDNVPRRWYHRFQLAEVAFNWMNLLGNLNLHVCGLVDLYMRRAGDDDVLPDRSLATIAKMHARAMSAAIPYLAREYVLYPALAGPFFAKVMAGNWLSSVMRNVFTGAAIYSAHIADDVADYPRGTKAGDRAHWYAMQLASTRNFDVPRAISILVGALDRQIEHHLFPKLPPNRLREISNEVRALCDKHGMPYRSADWPATLRGMVDRVSSLGRAEM
jgi:linoleoyl-CoA desaturase